MEIHITPVTINKIPNNPIVCIRSFKKRYANIRVNIGDEKIRADIIDDSCFFKMLKYNTFPKKAAIPDENSIKIISFLLILFMSL